MSRDQRSSPGAVLLSVSLGQFMVPFMFTSVGVGLPSMGRELGAAAAQLGLVEQIYALSLAMTMLTFGRLGDVLGRRAVFALGLFVFTAMTFALGFSSSIRALIAMRFFQGLGAAMLMSGSMALVSDAFAPGVRGRAVGLVSAATYAGLTLGPPAGGAITSSLGWRYVYWLAAPLGLIALSVCLIRMRARPKKRGGESLDLRGSLIYAVSVAAFMIGGAHAGEGMPGAAMMAGGMAGIVLFARLERRAGAPLLDMELLTRNRFFALSCLAAMGMYAAAFGATFFMSLYLQYARGLTPSSAGWLLLIQPLMQFLVSPAAGRMSDRIPPARLANAGMLLCCLGLAGLALTVSTKTPLALVVAQLALVGLGAGLFVTPNVVAIMGSVDTTRYGVASGMIGTMRTVGLAVSMTLATFVFSLLMHGQAVGPATLPGFMASMRVCLAAYAFFACCGMGFSLGRGKSASGTAT